MLAMLPDATTMKVAKALYESRLWEGYASSDELVSLKWSALNALKREPFYALARVAVEELKRIAQEVPHD